MKKSIIALASLAVLGSSATFAQSNNSDGVNLNGLYLGANYGYLRVESDDDFDDDKDAIQGLIGYRFNPYFAIEGSYIDFGDYGNDLAEASTDGYTAGVRGSLPLNDSFDLFVKVGQLWWETEYKALSLSKKVDDESVFVGGGLAFKITQNLSINATYTVYDADFDDDETNFETDLKQASVGLEYRF